MGADEGFDVWSIVEPFQSAVDKEFNARLATWPPDFARIHVHEVMGALLARQARLVSDIAGAPSLWNPHSAPIILRAIADVYINLSWLLLDPDIRCLKFISFGLGQAKLELEHRRNEMSSRQPDEQEKSFFNDQESWIESQRALFLQDVDLGKWSGLSVRQMADESGCIDLYNYVYTPFSACAHSMWHFVGIYNLNTCSNSLHRYHRRPTTGANDLDLHSLVLVAKYWSKTLGTFDSSIGFLGSPSSAYQELLSLINAEEAADT